MPIRKLDGFLSHLLLPLEIIVRKISFAFMNQGFSKTIIIAGTTEDVVIMLPDQQISKILIMAKQKSNTMSREKLKLIQKHSISLILFIPVILLVTILVLPTMEDITEGMAAEMVMVPQFLVLRRDSLKRDSIFSGSQTSDFFRFF